MDRSLVFVIDDFTDRIFDYPNTLMLDYGRIDTERWFDNYINLSTGVVSAYGTYDDFTTLSTGFNDFWFVTPDIEFSPYNPNFVTATTQTFDYDRVGGGEFVDLFGNPAFYDDYEVFKRWDEASLYSVGHGDWVVDTIVSNLDNPERSLIVCIDVDTLTSNGHFANLLNISMADSFLAGVPVTKLESLIYNFYSIFDSRYSGVGTDKFVLGGMSMSIAGNPATPIEGLTIKTFENFGSLIIQSAPNTTSPVFYDWGNNYPDVVNVGAWNLDGGGDLLLSSEESLGTVDIVANGYVTHPTWGSNFGTSFATPAVTAEYLNFLNNILIENENLGNGISENTSDVSVEFDYSELVNSILDEISTPIFYDATNNFQNDEEEIRLLDNTLSESGIYPTTVPIMPAGTGLDGYSILNVSLEANIKANFTGLTFTSGKHYVGQTLVPSVQIEDANGTSNSQISYIWYQINDDSTYSVITSGPSYVTSQSDVGKIIGVGANFTDDEGYLELSDITYFANNPVINAELTLNTTTSLNVSEDSQSSPIAYSATSIVTNDLQFSFSDPVNGSLQLSSATYVYVPDQDYFGNDTFTITVNDGVETLSQEITVNISSIPDDPILTTSNTITVDEDTASTAIAFAATDADGDELYYTFSTPSKGVVTPDASNGTYVYTPNTDANGNDSFTVSVNDGISTVSETVNITITAVNDDPILTTSNTISVNEDTPSSAITFSATDVDEDTLTYTFSTPTKGFITRDDVNGTYIYTPNTDANGNDSFTISVNDGTSTISETVNITITAVNDDPSLTTSNEITVNESTASQAIAFSATDADGDILTYTFSSPSKGLITRDDVNGTYVYTPNNGAIGSDSFDITVDDGTQTITNTISVLIIDVIEGTNGSETIQGTDQSDLIRSFSGTDTIDGSLGDDEIEGGLGSKTFVFKNTDGDDVIRYFDGEKDTILINEVELSIALADESSGVTEQINQSGDRLIEYGSGDSILLLDERSANPFEIIKVDDERWGSYSTYELRTKSNAAIKDIKDLSFKINWDEDVQNLLTGSVEIHDLLVNPSSVFDLDYLYNTDASMITVNRVPLVDDYDNGYVTLLQFNQGLKEQFSSHPIKGLSLTARANGDVDLEPSDTILKLILDRDPTDIETRLSLSELHYSQIETATRVPNLADVKNGNVTQEQFESEQPIPITSEVDKNVWDNETTFIKGDHLIGLQMKTKGNISTPNPLMYTADRSIGDGLSVRPIAKFKDVTKYEIVLKISDPMVELTDLCLPKENYEVKIQADFNISTFEIVGNSALNFTTEELEVMLEASSYLATDPSSAVAMTLETDAKKYQIWDELTLAQFSSGNEVSVKLDTSNLSLFDGSSGLKSGNYGILTFFAKNNKPDEVDVNFDAFATDSGASKLISSVAITSETVSARDLHSGSFNKSFLDGSEFYLLGDKWYSNPDHYIRAITASDALDVLKLSVGLPHTEIEKVAGDFDLNGRTNAMDAFLILNYAASKNLSELPRPEWRYSDNQNISSLLGVEGSSAQSWVESQVNAAESISATAILTGDVNGSYRPLWDDIDPLQDYIA
jgi:VCBS repeat-containing protein